MEPPRRPTNYPSDLTESQWSLIEAVIPRYGAGPRAPKYNRHDMFNAMRYRSKTGCQWRQLPSDFPPWSSVVKRFYEWNVCGAIERANDLLRETVRVAEGREAGPSLGISDSQSVKTTSTTAEKDRGYDANKKIKGRKRHIMVDILGLLIALHITPADVQDRDAFAPVLAQAKRKSSRLQKVLVDGAYRGDAIDEAATTHGVTVDVVVRSDDRPGFVPIPKRWVVERSFAWANSSRVLSKDYERTIASAEGWFYMHSIGQMAQRFV